MSAPFKDIKIIDSELRKKWRNYFSEFDRLFEEWRENSFLSPSPPIAPFPDELIGLT
jgi:hypothetical protein